MEKKYIGMNNIPQTYNTSQAFKERTGVSKELSNKNQIIGKECYQGQACPFCKTIINNLPTAKLFLPSLTVWTNRSNWIIKFIIKLSDLLN